MVVEGQIIGGRYRVEHLIGSGRFASVYAATDTKEGSSIALKVFLPLTNQRTVGGKRFVKRTMSAMSISHPVIVPITDSGETPEGLPCLVMERLEGITVEHDVESRGALPLARALYIAKTTLDGLAAAHSQGFVHGNINPSNVFLVDPESPRPDVRILDFGVARDLADYLAIAPSTIAHTRYLAPELLLDADRAWTPAVDVFAAGMVIFLMLTGRLPFDKEAYVGSGKNTINASALLFKLPGPAKFAPHIPGELNAVVQMSLAIEQQDRFKNGREMLQAFESALSGIELEQPGWDGEAPQRRLVTEEEWRREVETNDELTVSRDSSAASNSMAEHHPSEGRSPTESAQPSSTVPENNAALRSYMDLYSPEVPPLPLEASAHYEPTKKTTLPEVDEDKTAVSVLTQPGPGPGPYAVSDASDVPRFLGSPSEEGFAEGRNDENPQGPDTDLDITLGERESFETQGAASEDVATMVDLVLSGDGDTEIDVSGNGAAVMTDEELHDVVHEAMKGIKMPMRKVSCTSQQELLRDDDEAKGPSEDQDALLEPHVEVDREDANVKLTHEDKKIPARSSRTASPRPKNPDDSSKMMRWDASLIDIEPGRALDAVNITTHFPELRWRGIFIKTGIAMLACVIVLLVLIGLPRTW